MGRFRYTMIAGLVLAVFFFPAEILAQTITDPEAEYQNIRTIAFSGELDSAAFKARILLKEFPEYGDVRLLLGRILAWQKNYSTALAVIDTLLSAEPENPDALSARKDILLWSKTGSSATTELRCGYTFDSFGEPYERFWQVFYAGADHQFKWGPGSALLNVGNVRLGEPVNVNNTGFQIELSAYPHLTAKNYAYFSYAASPGKYFPKHRLSAEAWQIFDKGWSISAGLTYYRFDRNIFIAGASIEKYLGKYWLSAKGFIYFKDDGPTTSGYFNARRYLSEKDYLQVTISAGSAPDEPFDIQADLMRLSAYGIRSVYNRQLTSVISVRLNLGYSIEEFLESSWRNRFEGGIGFVYSLPEKNE